MLIKCFLYRLISLRYYQYYGEYRKIVDTIQQKNSSLIILIVKWLIISGIFNFFEVKKRYIVEIMDIQMLNNYILVL